MNKKYEPSKEERHENRRVDQQRSEARHSRQTAADQAKVGDPNQEVNKPEREGGFRPGEQQRAEQPKHRQQGGWNPDEDRSGRKPAEDRDRDYDPDGDRT